MYDFQVWGVPVSQDSHFSPAKSPISTTKTPTFGEESTVGWLGWGISGRFLGIRRFFLKLLGKKTHLTLSGLLFTARGSGGTCHGTRSGARPGMESSGTDNSQNWIKLAVFKRICSPLLGEMIQFDNIIFLQMGWFNHHLANVVAILSGGFSTKISSCRNSVIHSLRLYMLNNPGTCFLDWKVACLYHLPCS